MKYLGCYFQVNSCRIDIKQQIRKFYGNFNNIMSVLGRGRSEMAAVHLVNSYCVPTLTYACEIWNFSSSDYHTVSVLWNNAFRRIFNCCWRESTSVLQLYCGCLPMKYIIEQQTVLFYRRILRGSNVVLRSLLHQKVGYVQSLLSKFNIQSLSRPKHELKLHIWDTFVSETVCHV